MSTETLSTHHTFYVRLKDGIIKPDKYVVYVLIIIVKKSSKIYFPTFTKLHI